MIRLSREIRFALVSDEELGEQLSKKQQKNSWASWPVTNRLSSLLSLQAVIEGTPDATTGYLCNVTLIDKAMRNHVHGELIPSQVEIPVGKLPPAESVLRVAFENLQKLKLPGDAVLVSTTLHLSPYLCYSLDAKDHDMIALTHQFEFSAAHRLHCHSISDEENVATFGKCNNPAGHGHNYVVEVTVARKIEADSSNPVVMPLGQLAEIVNRNVIDVLDHKHLNEDIQHFANVNPSVENICAAIYDWLKTDIESEGCTLSEVKVFETPKTWASCSG